LVEVKTRSIVRFANGFDVLRDGESLIRFEEDKIQPNRTNRIKLGCPIVTLPVHGSINGRTLPLHGIACECIQAIKLVNWLLKIIVDGDLL
jgi:hypothetical protein